MSQRKRPPFDADERTQLLGWYQLQRDIIILKTDGLSEEDAHRVVVATSPLMTVAGVVSHLRWVEHTWYEVAFLGHDPVGSPAFADGPEDLDFIVAAERPLAELIADYRAQCARSDEIIAGASLDDLGRFNGFPAGHASLRWMVIHMVEETARHAGQLDIIRELLDGATSYY
ncbi:MAG: DinB family protein [Tetrasphaera sp.]